MIQIVAVTAPRPIGGLETLEDTEGRVAIAYKHVDEQPDTTVRTITDHVACLTRMMEGGPLIPARFPTLVQDTGSLESWLDKHALELAEELAALDGCVEVGIRGIAKQQPDKPAAGSSGREFMAKKLESQRQAESAQLAVAHAVEHAHQILQDASVRSVHEPGSPSASFLVRKEDARSFQGKVGQVDTGRTVRIFCTGSWPPFSFVRTPFPRLEVVHA